MELKYEQQIVAATGYQVAGKCIRVSTLPKLVFNVRLFHLSIWQL